MFSEYVLSFLWISGVKEFNLAWNFKPEILIELFWTYTLKVTNFAGTLGSQVPNKLSLTYFFSRNNSAAPLLLGSPAYQVFYFVRVTLKPHCRRIYVLNKKVISIASLKILEVNIHV